MDIKAAPNFLPEFEDTLHFLLGSFEIALGYLLSLLHNSLSSVGI
jgi:hypothetical protein